MSELASVWPHLSGPQVKGLAQYSLGVHLAEGIGLSRVSLCLGQWLGEKVTAVRERLRDFYRDAADKHGPERRELVVEDCFAGLLAWVLGGWPPGSGEQMALALDATTLNDRFVVLAVSVVYRGSAIPVAWKILPAAEPGRWKPHWLELLERLRGQVPAWWRVIVLADRGLYAKWLFEKIVTLGWHPFLRINSQGAFRAAGQPQGRPIAEFLTAPGQSAARSGQMFSGTRSQLACTLTACWSAGCAEPWLVLTDLPADQAPAAWYALRGWIERGFKHQKSGGLGWQMTRMTDPGRAARLWLVMAVATVRAMRCGTPPPEPPPEPPPALTPASTPAAKPVAPAKRRRPDLSVMLIGLLLSRMMLCQGHASPPPPLRPAPWPSQLPTYHQRLGGLPP